MALSIRNPRAEHLARAVARTTGETMTDAIIDALEDKLRKLESSPSADAELARIMRISRRCAALPTIDTRPEDEILGYPAAGE